MHFRERGKFVQIVRTSLAGGAKKVKSEIVGRLEKAKPRLTAEIEARLSAKERKAVGAWIESHLHVEKLKRELAVRGLPGHLALAEEWFKERKDDDARILAATLFRSWTQLRVLLKRNGLIE